jgi:two-component system invasion response regulator UvrY
MPKTKGNPKSVATTEPQPLVSIAIAEKDGLLRAGLACLLSEIGKYKILMQAETEAELLSLFEKSKNLPLIVIIDINTLSNNYEGIRKLKYDYPKVKVLVLVDTFSMYTVLNLLRCEANGIILKNSSAKELDKAITDIHTKNYYYTKQITKELFDGVRFKEIRVPDVTKKQLKFMELISSNLSYNEIAQRLDVGVRTIDGYRDLLFEKFNLQNRTDLVLFALKTGLISLDDTISTDAEIVRYREPDTQ